MTEQVTVTISKRAFERLQSLAAPLVDTPSTVVERLLDHWEAHSPEKQPHSVGNSAVAPAAWRSSRGDVLPVGTELQGSYKGKTFTARVERAGIQFNGKLFSDLSPAANAAKNLEGTKGKAANTNGRTFWKFQDPTTGQWVPVSVLRESHRIDSDELLAELERTVGS